MRKIPPFIILIFLTFSVISVGAEEQQLISQFDQVVTKEHFLTRQDMKNYIDEKSLEYHKASEAMIIKSLEEVKLIISDETDFFIFKIMLGVFAIVIFSGATWYFIRLKLEQRRIKIMDLRASKPHSIKTTPEAEKPLKTPQIKPESKRAKKKRIKKEMKEINSELEKRKTIREQYEKLSPEQREMLRNIALKTLQDGNGK